MGNFNKTLLNSFNKRIINILYALKLRERKEGKEVRMGTDEKYVRWHN